MTSLLDVDQAIKFILLYKLSISLLVKGEICKHIYNIVKDVQKWKLRVEVLLCYVQSRLFICFSTVRRRRKLVNL